MTAWRQQETMARFRQADPWACPLIGRFLPTGSDPITDSLSGCSAIQQPAFYIRPCQLRVPLRLIVRRVAGRAAR